MPVFKVPLWDIGYGLCLAMKFFGKTIRKWNVITHRDLGYFFSVLIVIYCLSGIALNHINDWNPDFIINKKEISFTKNFTSATVTPQDIQELGAQVGEGKYKIYDFPTTDQVKIYYDNATLHVNFEKHTGIYESVSRRPLFYQVNAFHRNSIKGWKWASDVFAVMLIVINITGLFILKGKHGIGGRGKWFILAGFLVPVIVWMLHTWLS